MIGAILLFNDKSQISLKAGALSFYQFEITFLNFSAETSTKQIANDRTLFAYHQVPFDPALSHHNDDQRSSRRKKIGHVNVSKIFHEYGEHVSQALEERAIEGFWFSSFEKARFHLRGMLASYNAHNAKQKTYCPIKRVV